MSLRRREMEQRLGRRGQMMREAGARRQREQGEKTGGTDTRKQTRSGLDCVGGEGEGE